MKRTKKRALFEASSRQIRPKSRKWVITLFIILFILFGSYYLCVYRIDRYIPLIENVLSQKMKKNVSIGDMNLRIIQSNCVRFSNVSIIDPATQQTLFTADSLKCYFSLRDILHSKKLHFTTISIVNPKMRISDAASFVRQTAGNKVLDATKKNNVVSASLFGGINFFSFDYALLPPDRIVIVDGTLELATKHGRDSMFLNNVSVLINHIKDKSSYELFLEGTQQNIQNSRITIDGTVSLPNSIKKPLATDDNINLRLGFENIDATPFFRSSSSFIEKIDKLNLSGTLTGSIHNTINFLGTISLPDVFEPNLTELYVQTSWNRYDNTLYADNILLFIYNTVFSLDGYYNISDKKGNFFAVSSSVSLNNLQTILAPVKKYSVKADTHLSAHIECNGKQTSYEGTVLFRNFWAQSSNFLYPLSADIPFYVYFNKKGMRIPESSFLFGKIPFLLNLRLDTQPEKQLFISINECQDIPLLSIFNASTATVQTQSSPTIPTQKQSPALSAKSLSPPPSTAPLSPSGGIPIYLSGLLKKPRLGATQLESVFFDTLIEGDRILFKDLDIALYGGSFRGNGIIQFHPITPYYSFVADFENIDINRLLSDATSFKDIFWGTLHSSFSFQTQGKSTQEAAESLRSQGMLKIKDGKIANINFMKEILHTFSTASTDNKFTILGQSFDITIPSPDEFDFDNETDFHTLSCDFTIEPNENGNNAFHTDSLKILSAKTSFNMRGNFDFEKNLDFTGDVTLSRIQTERMLHMIKEFGYIFKVTDERMYIPFRMSGTFDQPHVIPIIKMQNAQNIFENIMQEKLLNKHSNSPSDTSGPEYNLNLSEKDVKRIEKFKKKLNKYLGE